MSDPRGGQKRMVFIYQNKPRHGESDVCDRGRELNVANGKTIDSWMRQLSTTMRSLMFEIRSEYDSRPNKTSQNEVHYILNPVLIPSKDAGDVLVKVPFAYQLNISGPESDFLASLKDDWVTNIISPITSRVVTMNIGYICLGGVGNLEDFEKFPIVLE
jgi:hypothetical protein